MKKLLKLLAISILVIVGTVISAPSNEASAWATNQSADSICRNGKAIIEFSFKNAHYNGYKLPGTNLEEADITITATDQRTNRSYGPFVVHPQQTLKKTIPTGQYKINGNDIRIDMTWTHFNKPVFRNRKAITSTTLVDGVNTVISSQSYNEYQAANNLTEAQMQANWNRDHRVTSYGKTTDCRGPHVNAPEFTPNVVCKVVNGTPKYFLDIVNNSTTSASFTPANGSTLPNGNAVNVTAKYSDGYYGYKTVSATSNSADDCTPIIPVYVCNALNTSLKNAVSGESIRYTTIATAKDGAKITKYEYNFGDGNTKTVDSSDPTNEVTHAYSNDGNYETTVNVHFNVNGVSKTEKCSANVNVDTPEAAIYKCSDLNVSQIGKSRKYKIDADKVARNGAEFKHFIYNFGDGTDKLVTDKDIVKHTYNKDGKYTITAKAVFSLNGELVEDSCVANINVTTPVTPVGKALPKTGASDVLLSAVSLGSIFAATQAWTKSRRTLKETLINR